MAELLIGVPSFYFTTYFLSNQILLVISGYYKPEAFFSVFFIQKISFNAGFHKFVHRVDHVVRIVALYRVADFQVRFLFLLLGHSFHLLSSFSRRNCYYTQLHEEFSEPGQIPSVKTFQFLLQRPNFRLLPYIRPFPISKPLLLCSFLTILLNFSFSGSSCFLFRIRNLRNCRNSDIFVRSRTHGTNCYCNHNRNRCNSHMKIRRNARHRTF